MCVGKNIKKHEKYNKLLVLYDCVLSVQSKTSCDILKTKLLPKLSGVDIAETEVLFTFASRNMQILCIMKRDQKTN